MKGIELLTHMPIGISGHFERVEIVHAPTGIVRRVLRPGRNLITDAGLDAMGSGSKGLWDLFAYLAVGTDGTAPANSDTALGAEVGRTNSDGGFTATASAGPDHDYWEQEITRVFTEGQVDGMNLAELGFFDASSGGTLVNRQLFRDDVGNPTTIQLAADEQLRVVFAWRVWPPKTITTNTLTIGGTSTTVDSRARDINRSGTWGTGGVLRNFGDWSKPTFGFDFRWHETNTMPSLTEGLPTGGEKANGVSMLAYTNGNFYRDIEIVAGPSVGNFATGIGGLSWFAPADNDDDGAAAFTTFDPKVAKDDTKQYTHTARVAWARH